jgi:hypothetical protein
MGFDNGQGSLWDDPRGRGDKTMPLRFGRAVRVFDEGGARVGNGAPEVRRPPHVTPSVTCNGLMGVLWPERAQGGQRGLPYDRSLSRARKSYQRRRFLGLSLGGGHWRSASSQLVSSERHSFRRPFASRATVTRRAPVGSATCRTRASKKGKKRGTGRTSSARKTHAADNAAMNAHNAPPANRAWTKPSPTSSLAPNRRRTSESRR